ncbi:MAG: hypothetical protein M5U26_24300 [Planctomycetota bacterium]|nr:hypothetical protein [Planctomycetota bacterium]
MSEGMCGETAGFLFKHSCASFATQSCTNCGKKVCDDHARPGEAGAFCIACARTVRRNEHGAADASSGHHDDPYFYGNSYYSGWGHYRSGWGSHHYRDRDDFTEADGASTREEGDEEFETNMADS